MLNHHTFLAAILLLWSGKGIQAAEPEYWDISSVKEMPCPPDTEWKEWDDDFYSGSTRQTNPYDKWTFARGGKGDVHDGTGMPMALKEGVGNNDTALVSASEWRPPVFVQLNIQSTGAPGIPSTFNLRTDDRPGWKEIDFIIASRLDTPTKTLKHFVSTPLFVPNESGTLRKLRTLDPDREVEIVLAEGTHYETNSTGTLASLDGVDTEAVFQENWAITWDAFQPATAYHTYALDWRPDSIEWWAGEKDKAQKRITINKRTSEDDIFPEKGPFPWVPSLLSDNQGNHVLTILQMDSASSTIQSLRIGPWEAGGDWAGIVDWENYPNPVMKASEVKVYGCRLKRPDFEG